MIFNHLKLLYKKHSLLRFFIQMSLVVIVYFSIRYWKSIDDIKGTAPMILGQTIEGENISLKALRSKPVLVHFWATWCPICEFENPAIAALSNDYQVITIASWSENSTEVAAYLNEKKLKFPVVVDEDGEWAKLYGVKSVPASFVIDDKGLIRFIEKGYTTETGLRLRLWWLQN